MQFWLILGRAAVWSRAVYMSHHASVVVILVVGLNLNCGRGCPKHILKRTVLKVQEKEKFMGSRRQRNQKPSFKCSGFQWWRVAWGARFTQSKHWDLVCCNCVAGKPRLCFWLRSHEPMPVESTADDYISNLVSRIKLTHIGACTIFCFLLDSGLTNPCQLNW